MTIGQTFAAVRREKGMSQGDVENHTHFMRCYLSRCEKRTHHAEFRESGDLGQRPRHAVERDHSPLGGVEPVTVSQIVLDMIYRARKYAPAKLQIESQDVPEIAMRVVLQCQRVALRGPEALQFRPDPRTAFTWSSLS